MLTLYPQIKPYAEHRLQVDDLHNLYVEESGNPSGVPVLFLHGGPGVGTEPEHRRFFDPRRYRIILFDQRGCGKSTPHICLEQNTTPDLVEDMEKIRTFLKVDRWVLFGGSWGATLALLYAQRYQSRVLGMILRGIFLARQKESDWLYKEGGASRFFPDHWQKFVSSVPADQCDNIIKAYYDLLHGDNEVMHMSVAKSWGLWDAELTTLQINPDNEKKFTNPHFALGIAAIETHYFINKFFIQENQILDNASKLANIPAIIVHGRYDMVCPLENSYELSTLWPDAKLEIVRSAGHAAKEPAILHALIQATDEFVS